MAAGAPSSTAMALAWLVTSTLCARAREPSFLVRCVSSAATSGTLDYCPTRTPSPPPRRAGMAEQPIEPALHETMNKLGRAIGEIARPYGFVLLMFPFDGDKG